MEALCIAERQQPFISSFVLAAWPSSVRLREGKIGYELIRQIVDGGFQEIYAVNPKAQGAFGVPGFSAVTQIKQPVDLAIIASPGPTVPGVLEECGQIGIQAVVVISSGFSEVGNKAGEQEIMRVARRYGMRIVGPNCAGIVNTHHKLFGSIETRPPKGEVAFISQSGALGGAVLSWAEEQGMGFSKFLSYGNRVDLDEIDLLPYLAEDPETRVGALYIESVAAGRAFLDAVREFTRHKPLVVIKSGRSQSGQRATLSHTGSMAGSDAVYDTALRSCGAIRVSTVEEMFDLCKGFVSLPPIKGRRVAIVTNSGGPGVLAADRAEEVGLEISEPSPRLRERLRQFLPAHCALRNPIDLTVEGTEKGYRETLLAMLEEYDAALALDVSTPYMDTVALARRGVRCRSRSGQTGRRQLHGRPDRRGRDRLPERTRQSQLRHGRTRHDRVGADGRHMSPTRTVLRRGRKFHARKRSCLAAAGCWSRMRWHG